MPQVFFLRFCSFFFSFFSSVASLRETSFYRLQWGIHCGICVIIWKGLLSHIEKLVDVSSSVWRVFYMKYRQRHVLFDLCESDFQRDVPWRSSSLFYIVLFLNLNVSYSNVIETNGIWIKQYMCTFLFCDTQSLRD